MVRGGSILNQICKHCKHVVALLQKENHLGESFLYILAYFLNKRFFLFNTIFEFLTDGSRAQSLR
jgi:hypothetical protein